MAFKNIEKNVFSAFRIIIVLSANVFSLLQFKKFFFRLVKQLRIDTQHATEIFLLFTKDIILNFSKLKADNTFDKFGTKRFLVLSVERIYWGIIVKKIIVMKTGL